jgi:hypothetical protein
LADLDFVICDARQHGQSFGIKLPKNRKCVRAPSFPSPLANLEQMC